MSSRQHSRPTASSHSSEPAPNARTIAYVRVSTDAQAAEDRASLPEQEAQCRAFTKDRFEREVEHVWADLGISGRDESRLERLTAWCEGHPRPQADRGLIVALSRDRWGRFVHDDNAAAYFEYRLAKVGWDVDFVLAPKTENRTANVVMSSIYNRMAAAESEEKARRARMGMTDQASKGHWQGRPPFGYERVAISVTGKERTLAPYERAAESERVKLIPGNPSDARTVQRIFEWFAGGLGVEDIARKLNAERIPGPWVRYPERRLRKDGTRGTNRWGGFSQVDKILANPAYIGQVRWWPKTDHGQRRREPVVTENAHTALVERDVWAKVQVRLNRPRRERASPTRYLLTGLLRCQCGELFVGAGGTKDYAPARNGTHVQIGGKRSRDYRPVKPGERGTHVKTTDREANTCYKCPKCRTPRSITVNRPWLEARVVELVSAHVAKVIKSGTFDEVLDELLAAQRGKRQQSRRDFAAERRELERSRQRLVGAVAKGLISDEDARLEMANIRDAAEALDAEEHRTRFEDRSSTLNTAERQRIKAMAKDFGKRIQKADLTTARSLLSGWVAQITVDGRQPRKRTGRLVLRPVPLEQCDNSPRADR